MVCGIYMIKNKNTGQLYIGQSIDIKKRWYKHIMYGKYEYCHTYIDRAINKYGKDNFELIIIEEVPEDKLDEREKFWIEQYNAYKNKKHYNLTPGGDFNPMKVEEIVKKRSGENHYFHKSNGHEPTRGFLGHHHTQETKDKLSKKFSGKNNPMYGKKHSLETRKKISQNLPDRSGKNNPRFGQHLSDETKNKISLANKGSNHPMYGKHHSEEVAEKISKSQNTSGYYRVIKDYSDKYKQGFTYKYLYYQNGKQKSISSVDISKLEQKVLDKGLKWKKWCK